MTDEQDTTINGKLDLIIQYLRFLLQSQAKSSAAVEQETERLKQSEVALNQAIVASKGELIMAKAAPKSTPTGVQVIDDLIAQATANTSAEASAVVVLNGIPAQIQAAVTAALANGATAAQLAPIQTVIDNLKASDTALAAAIVANTPPVLPVGP